MDLKRDFQALILVGGLGKRLKPITETIPKPMVEINGKPFLETKINHLKQYNIRNIVLCVGYLGEKIEEYFGNGEEFGVEIKYVYEKELLGTAGAIKNAESVIRADNFLVMNGDTHMPVNFDELLEFHRKQQGEMTMVVTPANNPSEQELVEINANRITDFYIRNTSEHDDFIKRDPEPLTNAGIYLFNKKIFELIPPNQKVSLEREIFPTLVSKMLGFTYRGYMKDLANLTFVEELKKDLEEGIARRKIYRARAPVRITFGGGGTDISPYDKNHTGFCIGATINRYVYGSLIPREDEKIIINSLDFESGEEFENKSFLDKNGKRGLIQAIIKRMDPQKGFELFLKSDVPNHSGFGASASLSVVVIGLINCLNDKKDSLTNHQIAELAFRIEEEDFGNIGGRQDQYASVFGGVNVYWFRGDDFVLVDSLKIDKNHLFELEKNLLIVSTGKRIKSSGEVHRDEKEQGLYTSEEKIDKLHKIKKIAKEMEGCLREGHLKKFAELIKESWESKKRFNPRVTNLYIDHLVDIALKTGAIGGRLMGAGGGGHLLFYCEPHKDHLVVSALKEFGSKQVPFNFDFEGLQVWEVREEI